ncbi:hypothetical protein CWI37_0547p0010 [Hamiltosporidium tvaerminnensis]|uniref:DnaJ domain-containing protein n=1 Tax=Hamiltosporidium tvaerminnensis TaxID=1176355 RepID=A0A4Q9L4J6_9MICR|nr:hypothetical protein CWI37_0547p0010 [Hamiltosporidium tvaerminnensis]
MGQRQSKPIIKSSYDILEVDENATREEIRKKYVQLLQKNHPNMNPTGSNEKTVEIIRAYKEIMKIIEQKEAEPPKMEELEIYTVNYFNTQSKDDFYIKVNKLYSRIYNKGPQFGFENSRNFSGFYDFFKKYKTWNNSQNEDTEFQKKYSYKIREITNIICMLDPRIKKPTKKDTKVVNRKEVNIFIEKEFEDEEYFVETKIQTTFLCDFCSKKYKSKNQLLNHFRSKKHLEGVSYHNTEPTKFIDSQISELMKEMENSNLKKSKAKKDKFNFEFTQEIKSFSNDDHEEIRSEIYDTESFESSINRNSKHMNKKVEDLKIIKNEPKVSNNDIKDSGTEISEMNDESKNIKSEIESKVNEVSKKMKKIVSVKTKVKGKNKEVKILRKIKKSENDHIEQPQFLVCRICNIIFPSRKDLLQHVTSIHNSNNS